MVIRSSMMSAALRRAPSRRRGDEIPPPDQVVRGGGKAEDPIHEPPSAMAQSAQQPNGLHPAKRLLDEFAFPLAAPIAGMTRRPAVNGTAATGRLRVLRYMRRDVHGAHGGDPRARVIVRVV